MRCLPALFLSALALCAIAPRASSQFTLFPWVLDDSAGGLAGYDAGNMALHGVFVDPGGIVKYTTQAHYSGRVHVSATVLTTDGFCGGGGSTVFTLLGGTSNVFATCDFLGDLEFDVMTGQVFGFGVQVFETSFPYSLMLTDFSYTPFWAVLGGALAGSAGTPGLHGDGVLTSGSALTLKLSSAAPAAATTLVIGLDAINAPFKGGLLVPRPDLLLGGLFTDSLGQLTLTGNLPAGVPPHTQFTMQAWMVDAGGPAGLSASNAVRGSVL